ncbi:MAG: PilZ domain-containing protein [Planctomycetes bacterium]|nr:PilZ domain-containing protein [Planctomycetota bacterium]
MVDALGPAAPGGEPEPEGLKILSRAGTGRRSHWYAAQQVRLERIVALKQLRPVHGESRSFREAFLQAGRQAAAIVHPAAIPVFNVYPNQCCIAMQWCRGAALREMSDSLSPLRVAVIGEVVMDCLSSLHATGRCHGNITPGNIFLGNDGGVWLEDFFHHPVMRDGERTFTGEYAFIAPETLTAGEVNWRTDVYGLGRVLGEVLDREAPAEELGMLLDTLQSRDPQQRGGSPGAVLDAFRRLRRLEEARVGSRPEVVRRKRMYRRVPAEFDVSLRPRSATPGETATILMKTRDIGESGVFVETDDLSIRVGSILELDFTLKGGEGRVHAFGIVRWRSEPPMVRGVGVQFVEVDQVGLANLRRYLENR